jgi:CHAD domain-containing protein
MKQSELARTFGDWGKSAIEQHYQKIIDREPKVLKNKDPEHLHQMRVGMRRLRSAVAGFDLALDLPPTIQEKAIGKIAKVLGKLRDLDVLQETLVEKYLDLLPKSEAEILTEAIEILEKQRQKSFKQVKKVLTSDRYSNFKQDIQTWLEEPQYQTIAAISIDKILPDLLLPEISSLLMHSGWLLGANFPEGEIEISTNLDSETVENILIDRSILLHDLRKEAKKARYNLALFEDLYGDSYQLFLDKIKLTQEILGDIQDSFVLIQFMEANLETKQYKELVTFNNILQSNRYDKWQAFREIQGWFWQPQHRKDFKNLILYPK